MDAKAHTAERPLTPDEVGAVVRQYRETMGWSQETLAELSGLTVRTIQRVEAGQPSSPDTRRAIARGFRMPDLDVFTKPHPFPTAEELTERKAAFDREYLLLDAQVVNGRKVVAMLVDGGGFGAVVAGSTAELPRAAQDAFAPIVDFVLDCTDVADVASRTEMLGYGDQLDDMIAGLRAAGCCLCAAWRATSITNKAWADPTPLPLEVTYLVAVPNDAPPSKLAVPRRLGRPSL